VDEDGIGVDEDGVALDGDEDGIGRGSDSIAVKISAPGTPLPGMSRNRGKNPRLSTDGVLVNSQTSAKQGAAGQPPAPRTPDTGTPGPAAPGTATPYSMVLRSGQTDPGGEPVVLLRPATPRVVGPGRRERTYQDRIADLQAENEAVGRAQVKLQAEVEVSRLVERGTGRLVDRLERSLEQGQAELGEVRSQGHRLMVALGALQRENRVLHAELEQERARLLESPRRISRGGLLGRLWGGRRRVAP